MFDTAIHRRERWRLGRAATKAASNHRRVRRRADRVVAEIVPPHPGRSPLMADARLGEAVREGWLAPLGGSGPPPRKRVMTLRDLMQDLQRDRENRGSEHPNPR